MKKTNKSILFYVSLFTALIFVACTEDKTTPSKSVSPDLGLEMNSYESNENPSTASYSYYSDFSDESDFMTSVSANASYSLTTADVTENPDVRKSKTGKKRSKKIIKNGSLKLKTNTFFESKMQIDAKLKNVNGYYENEELNKTDEEIKYDLLIRIPSKNFEKLVAGIKSQSSVEVVFKHITTSDVSEEYLDIETRLANKKEYLKRYKELLSKAKNVSEILEIEEKIRQLMEEIESKEGRLQYLNDQVELSTLHVFLVKEFPKKEIVEKEDPFSSRAGSSLSSGWNSILNFLLWFVSKWPIIIVCTIGFWFIRKRLKKRKNAQQQ